MFGYFLTFDIPEVRHLQDWKPPVVTTLYGIDGQILYQFGSEKRIVIGLDQIPKQFLDGLIATEDSRFYHHVGIDVVGIARALLTDLIHLRMAQGASTITQQLARSLFLKSEKTMRRKLQEMVLALQIEKSFTKTEILTFYCNQVYMGHGRYGVEAASRFYFGKPAKEMTLDESALLAGLVQRPEAYSPLKAPDRARARRNHVLNRMVDEGMIAEATATAAEANDVVVAPQEEEDNIAPYFVEEVRRYLDAKYGEEALYKEGLEVHTTLDPAMQRAANDAIFAGLRVLDKRQGFRPIETNILAQGGDLAAYDDSGWSRPPVAGRLYHGLVTEVSRKAATVRLGEWTADLDLGAIDWTGKSSLTQALKVGDVAPFLVLSIDEDHKRLKVKLDQEPLVEGALIAIDPPTGEIRALVGGWDFNRSQFDRAVQSYRQAGSAFKPFVYSAALDSGRTLADTIFDEPTVFVDPATGDEYQPNNYYRKYYGITTLREALEESRNIVAVKLLNQVGYGRTIEIARRMGITSPLRPYPSMALGTMEVSLIDLATAYSVFPNQGVRVEPHFIRYVADRENRMREEAKPKVTEALKADVAYVMTYLLEGVTESGTGAAAARALNRPVAGKTGTTDDLADAWFMGFSPSLVAGVWVGFDQKKTLGEGETGAHAALPIWIDFMKAAHAGKPPGEFTRPANVVYVPIDRRTGLRATVESNCPTTFLEAFVEGTEPSQTCSAVEHFRISLPYYLQRFPINKDLELQIDPEALARLVSEGQGEVTLADGGKEIVLNEDGTQRDLRLDTSRSERREAEQLLASGEGGDGTPPGESATGLPPEATVPYGVDG
ncbi:MAG TPA: PBP1A family penicillin-binding protein, partial [Candidatus Polarisedimenticolia bacterium]|nr:PBP1A family penicillin-binding protein [Candidatus Polarisedimenticolia bacterium]